MQFFVLIPQISCSQRFVTSIGNIEKSTYVSLQLLGIMKISAILLKYPTFEASFLMFSWSKHVQNLSFLTFYGLH